MEFEEWYGNLGCFDGNIPKIIARRAWDHQQERIAELNKDVLAWSKRVAKLDHENDALVGKCTALEELNKNLVYKLDECQRAHDKLAGISNE